MSSAIPYGSISSNNKDTDKEDEDPQQQHQHSSANIDENPRKTKRGWSLHDASPIIGSSNLYHRQQQRLKDIPPLSSTERDPLLQSLPAYHDDDNTIKTNFSKEVSIDPSAGKDSLRGIKMAERKRKRNQQQEAASSSSSDRGRFVLYIIYAMTNVIISLPGLYGYAAVIFNHPVFQPHMNALSKLVVFSSLVHQLGFCLFSSLPFAIGTVQDAGLIFLSAMSNTIADRILEEGGTETQIISTTMVLLSLGTACLGLVLMLMGYFRLADAVAYLPMPVVGGYLAFIGYFCVQAGVALCISEAMVDFSDWMYLGDPQNILLAVPGLGAGLLLTWISRTAESPAALPTAMVVIPALFYALIFSTGSDLATAREGGWVGPVAPPVPLKDLLQLADLSLVRWDLVASILPTWVGMVFVVSFASCLDVAAISMDMGEALDTNRELGTVGIGNLMSGLTFGFTGSYIFSQTIFTFRTGVHSRWIGILIMIVFMYVVVSTINILQVAPLFFLGSTLIFIGWDLLYEWLVEIREKIFLSEYAIVWATFIAIQIVGIDAGILLGILVAIVDHVVITARTLTLNRVSKRSRAVWTPDDYKLLNKHGYNPQSPKILTLEVIGSIFFGSSLQVLETIFDEANLDMKTEMVENDQKLSDVVGMSPRCITPADRHPHILQESEKQKRPLHHRPPEFIVLDLTQCPNLDASSSRGCFLQLAKMAAKREMIVCVAGACPRVDWMLRSHGAAYELAEEERIKARLQTRSTTPMTVQSVETVSCERILMFLTIHEALEFCENKLIHELKSSGTINRMRGSFLRLDELDRPAVNSIGGVFSHILGLGEDESQVLATFESSHFRYHSEKTYKAGEIFFTKGSTADAFFVVLRGAVAVAREHGTGRPSLQTNSRILSGAGPQERGQRSGLLDPHVKEEKYGSVKAFYQAGGIFGYVDFLLERPRSFRVVASQDNTMVAKITRSQAAQMRAEEPQMDAIVQRVLLQASMLDLANCTCDE